MVIRVRVILSAITAIFISCSSHNERRDQGIVGDSTNCKYATGFRITHPGGATLVAVLQPYQGATAARKYLLVHRGNVIPEHDPSVPVIYTPVNRIVCTSTTHIPLLDYLGETDKMIGFPTTDYISSPAMRKRIDAGKVADLGVDKGMDLEQLKVLRPDMVMGYAINADNGQFAKIESMGIPVVINAEYLESHPLGRAEWIKFMALFFEQSKLGDSVFNDIESKYNRLAGAAASVESRPTVMSGIVYGDAWFLPGGKNCASKLLEDAGCNYLWGDDPSSGFLQLSLESVYEKAHDADLWIGVGTYETLKELSDADGRYKRFKPFRSKSVYTYDARKGAKEGSEFLELGYLRPDLILGDLIRIAHPGLLPNAPLYFHAQLR